VFGRTNSPARSSSSTIDPGAPTSTRRSATVTISAPEASIARSITSRLRKPPVPMISRELQPRPAISSPF
jgi:hypothetical protein